MHTDDPFNMIAIDVWDGNSSQVQIFRNNTGWQLPILMNGNAAGITSDYNCPWDYFFVIDHEGFVTWRGGPQSPSHPTLAAEVQAAIDAVGTSSVGDTPRSQHTLEGAYPNPFNPATRIPYELGGGEGSSAAVKLEILDLRGRVVRTLVDSQQVTGERYEVTWDGMSNAGVRMASGTYMSRLSVDGGEPQARLLTLVK
jgi:hypothetical protein